MFRLKKSHAIGFVVIIFIFSSCSLTQPSLKVSQLNYCAPTTPYHYDSAYLPQKDITAHLDNNKSIFKKYSNQDWFLANATGSFFLLKELVELQNGKLDEEDSIYCLVKKQEIFNRLLLASIELQSIAAELDCESERSKQLANYLDQINDTRVQKLTITSVVTGAATAIITSVSKDHNTQVVVGVMGSLISAVFGGLAAISSKKMVEVKHYRNLLADIWYDPEKSTVYPPFIWYVLKTKEFNADKSISIIQSLKIRWIEEGLVDGLNDRKKEDLFFGEGGKYHADDLHTRTSMLNQLKAEIRSINENLQSLMLKLSV
jgi:hypothetical protein